MYFTVDHLDFKRYVELADACEKALESRKWKIVAKLVHAIK